MNKNERASNLEAIKQLSSMSVEELKNLSPDQWNAYFQAYKGSLSPLQRVKFAFSCDSTGLALGVTALVTAAGSPLFLMLSAGRVEKQWVRWVVTAALALVSLTTFTIMIKR